MTALLVNLRLNFNKFILIPKRFQHGYVVLIPEIGEDSSETGSLLNQEGLPEFNNITIENCRVAISKQTTEFEDGVRKLGDTLEKQCNNIFKELFEPLDELSSNFETTWGLSKTLYLGNTTMPNRSYMDIHDRSCKARASKYMNKKIYEIVKSSIEKNAATTNEEKRMLRKFALEGRLNGLDLDITQRDILRENLNNLNKAKEEYKYKIDVATKKFSHTITDPVVTREFPPDLLKATTSDNPMIGPWKITLQPDVYKTFMEYCSDRNLRWNVWNSSVTRGSNLQSQELKTSLNIEEILYSRRAIAQQLGYSSYVEMSMETKMAANADDVKRVISVLLKPAFKAQKVELEKLYDFANTRGFQHSSLELWDIPYWRRKQRTTLFKHNEENFKEYFPLDLVLTGLFQLTEKLFSIQIKKRSNVVGWNKNVRYYEVFQTDSSAPVAGFYLDPYAKSEHNIGVTPGYMVAIRNLNRVANTKPLAALIFNFEMPDKSDSTYLTFAEVKNVFSKFGHALQHMLTKTYYSEVAGLSNIEWDAVETTSNFFSHWLTDKQVISSITSHRDTKEKMPSDMFENLVKIEKHMAGLDLCKELYLSSLDLELHSNQIFWLDAMKQLWPEFWHLKLDKNNQHVLSFTQIFYEKWGAAYYSHIWSRMLAADIYSAFLEVQGNKKKGKEESAETEVTKGEVPAVEVKDQVPEAEDGIIEVGKRYRETFLACGGSSHPGQVFREFRGRDPSPKALLSSLNLNKFN